MIRKVSVAEAKGKLPSIVHEVEQGSSVEITRHGKSVAVMIPTGDYERLKEKGKGFWNDLRKVRKVMSSEDVAIEDADFLDLRDSASGRSFEWPE
jgi:prevent-host-death family protein